LPIEHSGNLSFNAGAIGREAIARIDVPKMRMAAEIQENLLPRVIGPMVFRPGTGYLFGTQDNLDACIIPFVFDVNTTARIELTDFSMRVIVNDVVVARPSVSTVVTNGDFETDLTGWTDQDEAGAVSVWVSGYLELTGTGSNRAIRTQEVTVGGGDIGVEHALRVVINDGPVGFMVGSADQEDDYVADSLLKTGEHSLAFTPTGNFFITIYSDDRSRKLVSSCTIEAAGDMTLTTPWSAADMRLVRYHQSLDVIYCAKDAIQQRQIERRSVDIGDMRSWSLALYTADDGPFRTPNFTATTITSSLTTGHPTLTASRHIWQEEHVGALWRLTHTGQTVTAIVGGDDQWSDPIRISGVHTDGPDPRTIDVTVSGVFVATITIQIAFGDPSGWSDSDHTYTAPATDRFQDKLDNEIVYYRIGIVAGDYTSGSATVTLINAGGVTDGIVRIDDFISSTEVQGRVIKTIGSTEATSDWAEGEWSDYRGWPGAVVIDGGRLVWGWQDRVFMSVSDAYESYDDTVEGDAGPVIRTITNGSRDGILWLASAQRLLAGTAMNEPSMRSSALDEPITPTKFNARDASSRGCAPIQAVVVDGSVVFVQRGEDRAFMLNWQAGATDYTSENICRANDDILSPGVTGMAVQRNPDTRIWFCLEDGTAAVFTFEPADEVTAWTPIITNGEIVDISVLPGTPEDIVYWIVKRTVDGVDTYFHERMATLDQVTGGTLSRTMDSYVVYDGAPTATVSISHLPHKSIVVWADGTPILNSLTTDGSGNATLDNAVSTYVAGLAYQGRFQSAKNATGTALGIPLGYPQKLDHVALIMQDVTPQGISIGRNFDTMFRLPKKPAGPTIDADDIVSEYDYRGAPFDGGWSTDARVCVKIGSPHCGKFLAMAVSCQTGEAKVVPPRQG